MDAITERMNSRLRAKGLPLILPKDFKDSFVPTGIDGLDNLTRKLDVNNQGGLPRGKITEIAGFKSSGKSSLVKLVHEQHPELKILFLDAEGGLTAPPEGIRVVRGNIVEDIMPLMIESAANQEYDLIILDSVASLVTQKAFDGDSEGMAAVARAFGPQVKRLLAYLQPMKDGLPDPAATAAVFINQFRDTTKSFGKVRYTPGGRALEYYASLRLEFSSFMSKDKILRNKQVAGQKINVHVDKSRYGRGDDFSFPLMYDTLESFDDYYITRLREIGIT
jgi:RecA/RadA recombinase